MRTQETSGYGHDSGRSEGDAELARPFAKSGPPEAVRYDVNIGMHGDLLSATLKMPQPRRPVKRARSPAPHGMRNEEADALRALAAPAT
jgi:hypothetical protein